MRILKGLKAYLTDVKNLAAHAVVGILILLIALFLPVTPIVRALFLLCVITANIVRMRLEKRRERATEEDVR